MAAHGGIGRIRADVAALAATVVTVAGALLAFMSAAALDVGRSGALGLIEALPVGYLLGVAMVIVAFVLTVRREHLSRPLLTLQLATVICLLYGLTSYVEDIARLPTTWVHAGFIEYIQRTDDVVRGGDARFVWPGFFAAGALLNELAGTVDQSAFLAWAPLVLNLGLAVPVWVIARSTGAPERVCWLATLLFFLLNWVGQDYYSPQGVNFLLAVCFLAVVLRMFFTRQGLLPRWIRHFLEPGIRKRFPKLTDRIAALGLEASDTPPIRSTGIQKAGVVGGLVILYGASVVSHQLTPFFLIIITVGLVILDRVEIRMLPILMVVGVFVWISYAAASFWVGNLGNLFGDVGNFGNVVDQNVNNRVSGNPDHLPVIYSRLLLTAALWSLAAFGLFRRIRRGKLDVVAIVGFIAPFAVLGGQAYGGEAMLRVYLFALPFAATLAAYGLAPDKERWSFKTTAMITVISLALVPVYFLTRYGNESFEHFTNEERAAVTYLYDTAPPGSKLVALNSDIPWRDERIEEYDTAALFDDTIPLDEPAAVDTAMTETDGPSYLLVTRAQKRFAEMMQGQESDWADRIADRLLESGRFRTIYEQGEERILVPAGQP